MLQKIIQFVRAGAATLPTPSQDLVHRPYASGAVNQFYNSLFCDDIQAFAPWPGEQTTPWQDVLLAAQPSPHAMRALTLESRTPSHARALAHQWLRLHGYAVPRRQLHGMVVEMHLDAGLDVLAVFADGTLRCIDASGEPVACDSSATPLQFAAVRLLAQAQSALPRISATDQRRMSPPSKGNVRVCFLASDGHYVDDGPLSLMRHEPQAGRLIKLADEVRQLAAQAAEGRRPVHLHDVVLAHAA